MRRHWKAVELSRSARIQGEGKLEEVSTHHSLVFKLEAEIQCKAVSNPSGVKKQKNGLGPKC